MNYKNISRRLVLKQLASMSAIGAMGSLRSLSLYAEERNNPEIGLIPEIKGKVIHRQDEDYEFWRQHMIWHLSKPDRYPDIIVRAKSEQDVINAIKYAAKNKLKVTTRSGGHNAPGAALRDGGVIIDVSLLNDIEIDIKNRIASIGGGVKSASLVTAARDEGLSFPAPHCPTVGLSGFTMGGGIGWNYAHWGGMSCFSIEAADVVTAEGKLLRTSDDENPDLIWAIRGVGPGFFGVVTRLYLNLYPVPKTILVNNYIHPLDNLEAVTTTLDEVNKVKDDRAEVIAILLQNPEAPADAPPEQSKICFISIFAFAGSEAEAQAMLAPFAESDLANKSLVKIENTEYTFEGLYGKFFNPGVPAGMQARYAVDNVITNKPGETLLALADHFKHATSPHSHVLAAYAVNMKPRANSCFSSIGSDFVGCYSIWDNAEEDERHFKWLDETILIMDPFASGHYINEVEARRHPERIEKSFSKENWQRLKTVRDKYDPMEIFHKHLGYS
jgi:FAD/FMN-containing dehydrogenase